MQFVLNIKQNYFVSNYNPSDLFIWILFRHMKLFLATAIHNLALVCPISEYYQSSVAIQVRNNALFLH